MSTRMIRRLERPDGEMVSTTICGANGRAVLSMPGIAMLDVHCVSHAASSTVLLPTALPMSAAAALIGLPAHRIIRHPLFSEGSELGKAIAQDASIVGGATYIEFDRDTVPPSDEIRTLAAGRLRFRYQADSRLCIDDLVVHMIAGQANDPNTEGAV